jgi:small subunit ribosomal protein S6
MPFYENVFIARQDLTTAQVDALADQFTNLIKEKGGDVKKRESWGLRNLAFRIRKNRKGHYVLLNIDGPAAAVQELERTMRFNEDVIRFLTVKVEALEEGPSAVMQKRDDRGERGDRDRGFGGDRFGDRGPRRRDDGPREPRETASEGAQS